MAVVMHAESSFSAAPPPRGAVLTSISPPYLPPAPSSVRCPGLPGLSFNYARPANSTGGWLGLILGIHGPKLFQEYSWNNFDMGIKFALLDDAAN